MPGNDARSGVRRRSGPELTILHHLHVSDIRRSAREQANASAYLGSIASASHDPGDRLEIRDLDRANGRLPEQQRRVLLLIGLEGHRL